MDVLKHLVNLFLGFWEVCRKPFSLTFLRNQFGEFVWVPNGQERSEPPQSLPHLREFGVLEIRPLRSPQQHLTTFELWGRIHHGFTCFHPAIRPYHTRSKGPECFHPWPLDLQLATPASVLAHLGHLLSGSEVGAWAPRRGRRNEAASGTLVRVGSVTYSELNSFRSRNELGEPLDQQDRRNWEPHKTARGAPEVFSASSG